MVLPHSIAILRSKDVPEGMREGLFFGLYSSPRALHFLYLITITLTISAILVWLWSIKAKDQKINRAALVLSCLSFLSLSALMVMPWDEMFISLQHSANFISANHFSFSRVFWLEGTAEFFPYFILGLLGKVGVPLLSSAIVMSLGGGLLCFLVGHKYLKFLGLEGSWLNGGSLLLLLFPPLAINAGTAFATTVFVATALWSFYFLFCEKRERLGIGLLALLPLIRLEGVFLLFIFLGSRLWLRENLRNILLALIPILALTGLRKYLYGSFLPLPVQFKAGGFNPFFFKMGLSNFYLDLAYSFNFIFPVVWLLCWEQWRELFASLKKKTPSGLATIGLGLGMMGVFVVPYYIGGGDWFRHWYGRYLLPFSFLLFVFSVGLLLRSLRTLPLAMRFVPISILAFCYAAPSPMGLPYGTLPLKQLASMVSVGQAALSFERIDYLAKLGRHLKRTTRDTDRIGSSELATLMFYAGREAVDFLGVSNPKIIAQPSVRSEKEFGDAVSLIGSSGILMLRKVFPKDLVSSSHPEIIYPCRWEAPEGSSQTDAELLKALAVQPDPGRDLMNDFRYGGKAGLEKLHYRPIAIVFGNGEYFLYYVSPTEWDYHLNRLRDIGFIRTT